MHTGEPMCKMQSLQLNNLKHNRHENPIPFRMPCRDCRRRHKTDDKCRIRSQSTLYEAAWTPTSFVGMSCPSRGFCGNAISTRDINCIRAILGSTNAQDMARDMLELHRMQCKQCFGNISWTFMMPWGEDPGWELHSDRQRRGQGKLTVRGESGNRHGRREAGGRQGVTTLQHGQGSISSL